MQVAAHLSFGRAGNAQASQVSGWAAPEDLHTRTIGQSSLLRVALPPAPGDLLIDVSFTAEHAQRVGLVLDGKPIGLEAVSGETALGFRIPASLTRSRDSIDLQLVMPDAQPDGLALREILLLRAPPEKLAASRTLPPLPIEAQTPASARDDLVRGLTGLGLDKLAGQFESLGEGSAFGRIQRGWGGAADGLLSLAAIGLHDMLRGLDFGFDGVDDPAGLRLAPDALLVPAFGITRPARHGTPQAEAALLTAQRAAFLEALRTGRRLFVHLRAGPAARPHAMPILNLLRSHGPCALLFVTPGSAKPAGTVDLLAPDLYQGHLGADQAGDAPGWISLCANAYRLWRETGHGGG